MKYVPSQDDTPSRWRAAHVLTGLILLLCAGSSPAQPRAADGDATASPGRVIRILSPPGQKVAGRTQIETLTIDREVARVVFSLDGTEVATKKIPPFDAKIKFAEPPREQILSVRAFDRRGEELGGDEVVVNRSSPRFTVRITDLDSGAGGAVRIRVEVSLPRKAVLARLELYHNDELRKVGRDQPFEAELEIPSPGPEDYLRVVAHLDDGRSLEDVRLLSAPPGPGLSEEIDVNLVQIQTLVTLKDGAPITGLGVDDFEIRERGKPRDVAQMYVADDVSLNLGLVLDSSGSMQPIWGLAIESATQFLNDTMSERDRAFVVDFNTQVRLVHPLTPDRQALFDSLSEIEPDGGTALYDSILYSLLQFEDQPGRRALVVLTDGFDIESTSKPKRSVEFARLLGVPVYVLSLSQPGLRPAGGSAMMHTTPVHDLRLLTDPSGGRLIRMGSMSSVGRAFGHVNRELRNQYVLMYYSEDPPGPEELDAIEVLVPGQKGAQVRTVWALDQVN